MHLEEQVAVRDAEVFVARERELDLLTGLLHGDAHRVGFVTGPAGCGKSALLRELERRASRDGVPLLTVDEPDLDQDALRARLVSEPGTTRVVVASRRRPDAGWRRAGWDGSVLEVRPAPLDPSAARALLAARGVAGTDDVPMLVAWADGDPLSLVVAAAARTSLGRPLGAADLGAVESEVLDHLTDGMLAGGAVLGADRLVLAVAALAPGIDAELVEAVLPGRAGAQAERWLRDLPFAERIGHRVTLEPRVRRLVAAEVRRAEPDLERTLRLRIIDHLADAAQDGRPHLVVDIWEVLGPVTASGPVAWQVDTAATADIPALHELLAGDDPAYAAWVCRWVRDAPEHVLVVRHPYPGAGEHGLAALALWATSGELPDVATEDPHLADWLDRADSWAAAGRTLLNPVTEVFVDVALHPEVGTLVLNGVVQRCGVPNFQRWLAPRKDSAPDPAACGGTPDPALDLVFGSTRVEGYVIDYGPAGVIPALQAQAHAALSTAAETAADRVDVVRDALRAFHDPLVLATSPLATGNDPTTRAESVVRRVRAAIEAAFGAGPGADLQREVLLRGYLDVGGGHARAMRALHLSRTTYFRRLREATATLAAWLEADREHAERP